MRASQAGTILAAAVALAMPILCAAQEPITSFDQLNTRLKPGDTVWLTGADGREVKGKILEITPASLTIDGPRTLPADQVHLVRQRTGSRVWAGLGYGLIAGILTGGTVVAVACSSEDASCSGQESTAAGFAAVIGAAGAGVGALIGLGIPGRSLVVYRAPAPKGGSPALVSIAPVLSPRAKGVAVSFAF